VDVDLIERCRTRDPDAFAGFVALWGDAALRVATVVTGERGRALAAVRTALLTACRDFPSLHSERPSRPWLLGMVAPRIISRCRMS
jgi:DNA-directed RNA polymerase specialized sigma24 family protein